MEGDGRRVAVVGSGIAGASAAYLLKRKGHAVTLFEAGDYLGGHTCTTNSEGTATQCKDAPPVDLGFQVFNLTTYPNFVEMLEHLGVDSERSDMSFAISHDNGALEWGSKHGLKSLCAQSQNAVSPRFWSMVCEAIRFGFQATEVLSNERLGRLSLGAYLNERGYSKAFRDFYVIPMCAAIWSSPNVEVLAFPVRPLVAFWKNHHLLDLFSPRPIWRVVKGRSQTYVKRIANVLGENNVQRNAQVMAVRRRSAASGGGVELEVVAKLSKDSAAASPTSTPMRVSSKQHFDMCVLAVHSDQALKLLGEDATAAERDVLSAIPYAPSDIYLHDDTSLMPRRRGAWGPSRASA